MTDPLPTKPKRRGPNAVRRLQTRHKLLEATIACLHEFGYHRTTTLMVIERASVARGSLLHQFPSKADLMMAVAEHIAVQRGEAHVAAFADAPDGPARMARLVDVLWGQVSSPSGTARLEIMLGSRSDPDLSTRLNALNAHLDALHREAVWALARSLGAKDRAPIDAVVQLYAAALRGLAVDALFPHSRAYIEAALEPLRKLLVETAAAQIAPARSRSATPRP